METSNATLMTSIKVTRAGAVLRAAAVIVLGILLLTGCGGTWRLINDDEQPLLPEPTVLDGSSAENPENIPVFPSEGISGQPITIEALVTVKQPNDGIQAFWDFGTWATETPAEGSDTGEEADEDAGAGDAVGDGDVGTSVAYKESCNESATKFTTTITPISFVGYGYEERAGKLTLLASTGITTVSQVYYFRFIVKPGPLALDNVYPTEVVTGKSYAFSVRLLGGNPTEYDYEWGFGVLSEGTTISGTDATGNPTNGIAIADNMPAGEYPCWVKASANSSAGNSQNATSDNDNAVEVSEPTEVLLDFMVAVSKPSVKKVIVTQVPLLAGSGQKVEFSAAIPGEDSDILCFEWDFCGYAELLSPANDDKVEVTLINDSKVMKSGFGSVNATIKGEESPCATGEFQIIVMPLCIDEDDVTPNKVTQGNSVEFSYCLRCGAVTYAKWEFGNLGSPTSSNQATGTIKVNVTAEPGEYDCFLTLINDYVEFTREFKVTVL